MAPWSSAAPLDLCPGFSRPPAHAATLGEIGRRKREEEGVEKKMEEEEGREGGRWEEEEGGGKVEGGVKRWGQTSAGQGYVASALQIPSSRGLAPSTRVSCFTFTAGLFTGLSVQRKRGFMQHLCPSSASVVLGGGVGICL